MRPISLDCLTLSELPAAEMIRVAADAGYASVSIWVQAPILPGGALTSPEMAKDILRALSETGVTIGNLEVFNLNTDSPIADFEPALVLGAGLGARTATSIDYGSPRADIAERLWQFHELAARHGLRALIEPISMGVTRTIGDGLDLIDAAGVDVGLVVDCAHLIRTGCGAKDIARADPRRIAHLQLCDGLLNLPADAIALEASLERLHPGEGEFPLVEILRATPAAATVGLEAPSQARRERGESPLQRARDAYAAARTILNRAGGSR